MNIERYILCSFARRWTECIIDGFHSVEVAQDSQHLLTFITEWGRYIPLRLPQGYFASGDAYTHRTDILTEEVARKVKIVDDS